MLVYFEGRGKKGAVGGGDLMVRNCLTCYYDEGKMCVCEGKGRRVCEGNERLNERLVLLEGM